MELINENLIGVDVQSYTRIDVISNIAQVLYENQRIDDIDASLNDVYLREAQLTTAMGFGVAIPHAQSHHTLVPSIVFIKLQHAIQWNEDDHIEYVFGITVPFKNKDNHHLEILSNLARRLMNEEFRTSLSNVKTKKEGISLLSFLNKDL